MSQQSNPPAFTTGLHHVAFRVQDFDRAVEYFVDGLGFSIQMSWILDSGEKAVMLGCGQNNIVEIFSGGESADNYDNLSVYHFALRTNDIHADHQRALDAGGTERMAPKDIPLKTDQGDRTITISFVKTPVDIIIEFFANGVL